MLELYEALTQKYARAFCRVYQQDLSEEVIKRVEQCYHVLSEHKQLDAFLMLTHIAREKKMSLLHQLLRYVQLPASFEKLAQVLLEHRRIEFFAHILKKIQQVYQEAQHIVSFSVSSSSDIETQDRTALTAFIQRQIPHAYIAEWLVDESLICGIRLQSKTQVMERSIRKQLKSIELKALERVQL